MAKTSKERLDDTLSYLADHVTRGQALEVATLLSRKTPLEKNTLSELMSLREHGSDGKNQRRAVRANVLISQLFIDTEYYRGISVTETALDYLKRSSERQLVSRLKSWWADPTVTEAAMCRRAREAAGTMPVWGNSGVDPARLAGRIDPYDYFLNCFSGVMYWAYLSGAVSLRWLWNTWAEMESNDQPGVRRNYFMGFSNARVWKKSDMVLGEYVIPAGHTVQFVNKDNNGKGTPFGHVVLSLGHGRCLSQNGCHGFREQDVTGGVPPEDRQGVIRMKAHKTHEVYLRTLREGFYSEKEGYHTMHSAPPFWLHGLN